MKKIILSMAMAVSCMAALAQGALTVNNNQDPQNNGCGVYVSMHAVFPLMGNGLPCDVLCTTFYVPAGGTASWVSAYDFFNSGPGLGMATSPFVATDLLALGADFEWTDVEFQWDCPVAIIPPCSNAGSAVNSTFGGPLMCFPSGATWTSPCGLQSAVWSPLSFGTFTNVTINFN